ncbi:MAG: hypothetical protein ACLTSZ_06915 [Lachnospiraceae bacterium]
MLRTLDELGYVQLRGRDGQIWIGDDTFMHTMVKHPDFWFRKESADERFRQS